MSNNDLEFVFAPQHGELMRLLIHLLNYISSIKNYDNDNDDYDNDLPDDREAVESCEKWANSTTQQVDLAFNIFFMVYFFIRVRRR